MALKPVAMRFIPIRPFGYGSIHLSAVAIVLCLKVQWLLVYNFIISGYGSIPKRQVVLCL